VASYSRYEKEHRIMRVVAIVFVLIIAAIAGSSFVEYAFFSDSTSAELVEAKKDTRLKPPWSLSQCNLRARESGSYKSHPRFCSIVHSGDSVVLLKGRWTGAVWSIASDEKKSSALFNLWMCFGVLLMGSAIFSQFRRNAPEVFVPLIGAFVVMQNLSWALPFLG